LITGTITEHLLQYLADSEVPTTKLIITIGIIHSVTQLSPPDQFLSW
jgi:hypothetical protein